MGTVVFVPSQTFCLVFFCALLHWWKRTYLPWMEGIQSFTIKYVVIVFSYTPFISLRTFPSVPSLLSFIIIIINDWMLSSAFFLSFKIIIIFLFYSINSCTDFFSQMVFITEINSTWSSRIITSIYCWIQFASVLLRVFVSVIHEI